MDGSSNGLKFEKKFVVKLNTMSYNLKVVFKQYLKN